MPAKKKVPTNPKPWTQDKDGKMIFPAYKPVGRTRAQTRALMEMKGMHEKMIAQATKYMKE
tara:strand:+ start:984 stop:1166 length:183 start_codon:yes stop_codon:yes gene_type:complete